MTLIRRKTNVRRHNRQNKHVVATVRNHDRRLKPRKVLGVIPLKRLNYPQAKTIFPTLEPYGDIDRDGVVNSRDCRPFDVDRQDDDWPMSDEDMEAAMDEAESERLKEEAKRDAEEERRPHLEGTPEEQEQASENISDMLARQRQKERDFYREQAEKWGAD